MFTIIIISTGIKCYAFDNGNTTNKHKVDKGTSCLQNFHMTSTIRQSLKVLQTSGLSCSGSTIVNYKSIVETYKDTYLITVTLE